MIELRHSNIELADRISEALAECGLSVVQDGGAAGGQRPRIATMLRLAREITDRTPAPKPETREAAKSGEYITLTGHEVQARSTRQKYAEGLILQLPKDHDGRNTWLLNYGVGEEAVKIRERNGAIWNPVTQAAMTSSETAR
jgi:hypothetical protein